MTLKEIANEVGVSISTVSRVLNNPNSHAAGQAVQTRIWDVVRRTGYSPNPAALELKKSLQARPVMRPIYSLLACPPGEVKDDPFFARLTSSIEQEAFQNNFILKYTYSMLDLEEGDTLRQMRENTLDSLIIVGRFPPELLRTLKKKFKRIVYVGLNTLNADCDQVVCDGYLAIQEAVRYLYQKKHTDIGYIGADHEGRYRGYLDGLSQCGLSKRDGLISDVDTLSMDGGFRGMAELLRRGEPPTAVICANDMTAIGALRACKEKGIRVPQDLSLMGMNDIPNVKYVQPMLTSIHVPLDEMGAAATKLLIDRINGGHTLNLKISFPFYIEERESCALNRRA